MRIFSREKQQSSPKNISIGALATGLLLAFMFGVAVGFSLANQPETVAEVEVDRYDIPIDEYDAVYGSPDAPVVIVEFTDYQCPYCQRYYVQTFSQIIETYGDQIYYVVKDLPLVSIHPEAVPAAIAAHCAEEQDAFWEYHEQLFLQEQGLGEAAYQNYAENLGLNLTAFNQCLDSSRYDQAVLADTDILESINAPISTPTFFINGQYIAGAQAFSTFAQVIDAELETAAQ